MAGGKIARRVDANPVMREVTDNAENMDREREQIRESPREVTIS